MADCWPYLFLRIINSFASFILIVVSRVQKRHTKYIKGDRDTVKE